MNEDDRKKYLEELMQPHIPLRVLQEIRQEIDEQTEIHADGEFYIKNYAVKRIIDKHIEEIEK